MPNDIAFDLEAYRKEPDRLRSADGWIAVDSHIFTNGNLGVIWTDKHGIWAYNTDTKIGTSELRLAPKLREVKVWITPAAPGHRETPTLSEFVANEWRNFGWKVSGPHVLKDVEVE